MAERQRKREFTGQVAVALGITVLNPEMTQEVFHLRWQTGELLPRTVVLIETFGEQGDGRWKMGDLGRGKMRSFRNSGIAEAGPMPR